MAYNDLTPLIILSIVSILLTVSGMLIVIYNSRTITKNSKSLNDDYTAYKNKLKEQNDILTKQLLSKISEQENSIFDGVNDSVNEKNLMNVFVKLREAIKENCVSAMTQIGAARIAIYLFHNGVKSTHGISFYKMSCICEKVAIGSGVRERMIEHNNIPVNLFDEMIEKLTTYNRYIIMNNDETQDTNHRIFISADKIYYTQLVTIYDINNNLLGFIAVEMDRPYSKDEADTEKDVLDELSKQLIPVLSYSDYISLKTS